MANSPTERRPAAANNGYRNADVVKLLLEQGAAVNVKTGDTFEASDPELEMIEEAVDSCPTRSDQHAIGDLCAKALETPTLGTVARYTAKCSALVRQIFDSTAEEKHRLTPQVYAVITAATFVKSD